MACLLKCVPVPLESRPSSSGVQMLLFGVLQCYVRLVCYVV